MTSPSRINLAWPTDRTSQGPRLIQEKENLVVEYDCEQDNGEPHWSRVTFQKPLLVEYRDIACCRDPALIESKAIRCLDTSPLLAEVMTAWQESVGWQDWQKKNVANKIRHYTLFFDDAGCLNVVGTDCFVEDTYAK